MKEVEGENQDERHIGQLVQGETKGVGKLNESMCIKGGKFC